MAKRKPDKSGALFRAIDRAEELRQALRAQRGKIGAAKSKSARTRARNTRDTLQRELERATRKVDALNKQVPKPRKRAAPSPARAPVARPEPKPERAGTGAIEWEIGLSYDGSRRQGNSVMVNFRIFKRDGSPVMDYEAREAVRLLHRGEGVDEVEALGLSIDGVEWQGASRRGFKSGRPGDLESFSAIMQTTYLKDFRVSPVKDDE